MTGAVRRTTATVHRAVYRTDRHTPVNLCLSQPAWTTTTKRTEQNLSVRSGKSEAEVSNNRRLRSMYCTIEATDYTDRHEASRGLAATAELLVYMFVGARRRFDAPSPVRITEHF